MTEDRGCCIAGAAPDRQFAGYIFDLDGTTRLASRLVSGARETVCELRERGKQVLFLTNNSDGTQATFAEELTTLGIPTKPADVVSVSYVTAQYLARRAPNCRCYVVGPEPLREELRRAGLAFTDRPGDVEYVILGIDRDITYKKLQTAFTAIRAGAVFVATNPDPYMPAAGGDLIDIGAFIAALETASGHGLDILIGKPSRLMVDRALETLRLPASRCLMIGDQPGTDVLAGHRAGVATALLLRDPLVREASAQWPEKPEYLLERLTDLL